MPTQRPFPGEYRASNGLFYKVTGNGDPLLLLHGLMATGAMFDPLVPLLQSNFRMIIPDLRGHGESGDLPGPYDVPSLTADLDPYWSTQASKTARSWGIRMGARSLSSWRIRAERPSKG